MTKKSANIHSTLGAFYFSKRLSDLREYKSHKHTTDNYWSAPESNIAKAPFNSRLFGGRQFTGYYF